MKGIDIYLNEGTHASFSKGGGELNSENTVSTSPEPPGQFQLNLAQCILELCEFK